MPYQPKSREEYIALCHYYDGTESSLKGENGLFADYERLWVDWHYSDERLEYIKNNIADYKAHGLGHFNDKDGVPIAFKSILWNRYCQWDMYPTPEKFKVWYKREYLKEK